MTSSVEVSVPGRICLAGENIDWMVGPVITAALRDLRVTVQVALSETKGITVSFEDGRVEKIRRDSLVEELSDSARYVFGAAQALNEQGVTVEGVEITVTSSLPTTGGLASSGALCVALVAGIAGFYKVRMTKHEIAALAYVAEHDQLGIPCGQMDQFAVATGGILALDCAKTPPDRSPLKVPANLNIVVGWTDTEMTFADFAVDLKRRWEEREPKLLKYVTTTVELTRELTEELRKEDVDMEKVGRLINSCHVSIREDKGIVNEAIEDFAKVARQAGAYCAKSSGARSSGGSMFALCDGEGSRRVFDALVEAGAGAAMTTVDSIGLEV